MELKLNWYSKAKSKYKKAYAPYHLSVFPLIQSKWVELTNGKAAVVGNSRNPAKESFLRFMVVDEQGQQLKGEEAKAVHRVIAILQSYERLEMLKSSLTKADRGQSTNNELIFLIDQLCQIVGESKEQTVLTKGSVENLFHQWDAFWRAYQDWTWRQNETIASEQEKELVSELIASFVPWENELTMDLNQAILSNYEQAQIKNPPTENVNLSMFNKMLLNTFTSLMRFVFFVVNPLLFILFLTEGFDFSILMFPAISILVYFPLLQTSRTFYQNRTFYLVKGSLEKERGPKSDARIIGQVIDYAGVPMFIGLPLIAIGIVLMIMQGLSTGTIFMLSLGCFFLFVGIVLMYSPVTRKSITFTEDMILYGKQEVFLTDITKVIYHPKSRMIRLQRTNSMPSMVVIKSEEEKAIMAVESWAERVNLPFEVKE
ncbi:hypothetical protein [Halalkalibacter krulwichiae]|uniref:Uncharacterized protein n=1 Tax=Halalkalibacter krulwichiae TaxID=199441 RepID=A0A1X9MEW5_9BACI|nr:hypothetical protein [Halalkalibacter krulwichiae]ARK31989.1 hypothetical protein BkAM31D_20260 [Halalkalibacter krulwichiae]